MFICKCGDFTNNMEEICAVFNGTGDHQVPDVKLPGHQSHAMGILYIYIYIYVYISFIKHTYNYIYI